MRVFVLFRLILLLLIGAVWCVPAAMSAPAENTELEATVRDLVRANAEKDESKQYENTHAILRPGSQGKREERLLGWNLRLQG